LVFPADVVQDIEDDHGVSGAEFGTADIALRYVAFGSERGTRTNVVGVLFHLTLERRCGEEPRLWFAANRK